MVSLLLFFVLQRTYHKVPLGEVVKSQQTHVETCGQVVYVRKQLDGDWHVTLAAGTTKVVVEIIPNLPLSVPKKNQWIRVRGIRRFDNEHGWPEIHPLEWWEVVVNCKG